MLARARAEGIGRGKLLGLIPFHNGTKLVLDLWMGNEQWQPAWEVGGESEHAAGSVDRPGSLRAGWLISLVLAEAARDQRLVPGARPRAKAA